MSETGSAEIRRDHACQGQEGSNSDYTAIHQRCISATGLTSSRRDLKAVFSCCAPALKIRER